MQIIGMVLWLFMAVLGAGCANIAVSQDQAKARILVGSMHEDPRQFPAMELVSPLFVQYAWLSSLAYDDAIYGLDTGHGAGLGKCAPGDDCNRITAQFAQLKAIWGERPIVHGINDCSAEAKDKARRDFGHEGKQGQCGVEVPGRHRVLDGMGIQIWMRRDCTEMVVAFRGTDFHQSDDWLSNFRWITRILPLHDQYEQAREHVDRMIEAALAKSACKPRRITAVGHSLGGGLAQHAAYSQNPRKGRTAITRVYVFNPSFVTGFEDRAIKGERLTKAISGLKIDRIYEHGEILAYPRFVLRHLRPPTGCDPQIRLVRVDVLDGSLTQQHAMAAMTRRLLASSPARLAGSVMNEAGILPSPPEAIGESGKCTPEALAARRTGDTERQFVTSPDQHIMALR
jgi:pimeloyl-ACP methyl ester carboxylesterase